MNDKFYDDKPVLRLFLKIMDFLGFKQKWKHHRYEAWKKRQAKKDKE